MNSSTPIRDGYLGTAEAAKYVSYSEWHWRRLVNMGKAPRPLRLNGKLLWRKSLLDQFLHNLEVVQGVIPPDPA